MYDAANGSEDLKVDVTVVGASQLPNLKTTVLRQTRQFYVTAADGSAKGTKKTKAIRSAGNAVNWNEKLEGLHVQSSSHIIVSLYAKNHKRLDDLIGTVKLDPISTPQTSFTIKSGAAPPPILILTIVVYANQRPNLSTRPSTGEQNQTAFADITQELRQQIQDTQKSSDNAEISMKNVHVLDDLTGTIDNIQSLILIIKALADVHPVAKLAFTALSAIPKAILTQIEIDANVQDLVKAMRATVDLAQEEGLLYAIKSNSNQAFILKVMLTHITTCAEAVRCYAKDESFRKRFVHNIIGGMDSKIKNLCDTLAGLRQGFLDNASINTQITVHDMQKSMELLLHETSDIAFDINIRDLPYYSGWSSTENKNRCLEGTRTHFIDYITKWIQNPSSKRGVILYGQLGAGKSSIAFEIASRFYLEGSYFSFSRTKQLIEDHHLVTTIIRDMADRYPAFKREVGQLIATNAPLRTSDNINQLFNVLLLNPLEKVERASIPNVIVIDALDESKNSRRLAQFLSQSLAKLPSNVRVLITSRPENSIHPAFPGVQDAPYEVLQITDSTLAVNIDDDIRLYLKTYLKTAIFQKEGERLVKEAGGLFQWAAVACGYINEPPAGYTTNDCLRGLLGQDVGDKVYTQDLQSTKLYKLYKEVLSSYFTSDVTRPRFRSVMGHLFGAFEPFSVNTLNGLRHYVPFGDGDDESVLAVVKFMGSLLSNVTSNDRDLPVVPLHTSFRDFLIDTTNTHSFSLNLVVSHTDLTHACFDLMLHDLKFNICKLESSHLPNAEVGDLQTRIEKFISPPLFYACRFWDDHLDCITFDTVILNKLNRFFLTKLLFWFEVLSVTETVPLAVQAITSTLKWLKKGLSTANPEIEDKIKALVGIVTDALAFVRFFGNVIATSAPHIYVSSLPFTPRLSEVYKIYSPKFPATLSFIQGQMDYWPALEMSIATPYYLRCVEFSPDGQWIASGLMYDDTIYLWNATTGKQEGSRFTGHTDTVQSIAFSSDGRRIISGSMDCTIRLWNVATGTMEGNPWVGHEGYVTSVAFSPNGAYAVSGSNDRTVRIWNVANGSMEGSPMTGHIELIASVAFSSDGEHVISGSEDCTVRVWKFDKVEGRVEIAPLFTLHTPGRVFSVTISPNGQQIAAGCLDHNIHLWNTLTKPSESIILAEHTKWVGSIKFSPDGQHLVSGSADKLCIWNTSTNMVEGILLLRGNTTTLALSSDGQRIVSGSRFGGTINIWNAMAATRAVEPAGAVTGHIGEVTSVAYSPVSGQHSVASGSRDATICLWDVKTGSVVGSPLQGHTDCIKSIAFSPNGQQLVSGSIDHTVRVWNVDTGTEESTLIGHTNSVISAAFSPDGQWIVSGDYNGGVFLWNTSRATDGCPLTGCSDQIFSVGFSPDSRQVVSATWHSEIWVWDISGQENEGRQLGQHTDRADVMVVSFVTNDRIISCNQNGTVDYWSTSTGKIDEAPFDLEIDKPMTSSALSPDCSRLSVGFFDGSIFIWNLATRTRENLRPMIGHTGWVNSLAFSPDGHQLVSGSFDSTIRIWDISRTATSRPERPLDPNLAELNEDGWLVGKNQELLVWIPQHYRFICRRPDNLITLFPPHLPHLDFSQFVHGEDWHSAYKASIN